jgi:predicted RND superfamily exporter protein
MRGKDFALIVDTSITQCIGRSLLTSFTTLLTVLALFFFAMGDVKEFGRFMIVGIISGSYSTIFIAAPIVLSWINAQEKSTGVLADQKVVKEAGRTSGAGEKAQAASLSESSVEEAEGVVIPTATRKLHGKRQDAKKKKR